MLFCFDIDGTLLDNNAQSYPDSTIQTLRDLKSKGHQLAIATGRNWQSLADTGIIDLVEWDGMVLNNGQVICDGKGKSLHKVYLLDEAFQKIRDLCKAKDLNYSILTDDDWYAIKENDLNTIQAHRFFNESLPRKKSYKNEKALMLMIYGPEGYDYREFKEIEGITVVPGVTTYADVFAAGVNKYKGIEMLLECLNVYEYVGFGDAGNDIEMLDHAKIGIAMGQSSDEVKKHADFVTKSCAEDGIAHACRELHFID